MSKNKKIVSVDPGTGAGAISDVREENTLPCSAHGKKKLPATPAVKKDVPAETEEFVDRTVQSAVENTLGLDLDKPASSGEPTAVGAALSDDVVKQIMQSVPGLSEEDVRSMEEDEIQLFTDLLEMNAAMKEVAVDLQKSADQGGPSSVVGFFRFYMALTKIGVNELAAQTGIIRLRLTSILQETVDMTPGEMTKIKEVLLPRYMRWKELQDRPENKARLEAREKKRMEKKRKKSRSYDPITGMAR